MNLAEALVQALPELPSQTIAKRLPRFNPDAITRDDVDENGDAITVVYIPEKGWTVRMPRLQYQLLQLFDGVRTYPEVVAVFGQQTGQVVTEEQLRELVANSDEAGIFYVSAQEKNLTLKQKLSDERQKRLKQKGKYADLAHIMFKGWDPDRYLELVHDKVAFVFTPWFTLITLFWFGFMGWIWIDKFSEIGRDSLLYYNFTQKNGWDLAEFWILFLVIAFFHESSHGISAKHYGASVHNMGFQLIYLTPSFMVEVTELWVRAGRWQRMVAIIAGIWVEMIFCAVATVVWWGTPPGSSAHEWAYKVMLITGIMVIVMNLNPLIKLDGYYVFSEITGIADLKEKSTAYWSGWFQKNVLRLPVEYDYVPPRRRWIYIPFSILSGVYSYGLLFAVSRFTYNVCKTFTPEWAFIPAGLMAWKIFHSRILRLGAFMKTVYLDKRDKLQQIMTPKRWAVASAMALALLLLPIFHKTEDALFVLEPAQRAEIRAMVPGFVNAVFVHENETVSAGAALLSMNNVDVQSASAKAQADLSVATANRDRAHLQYANLGPAEQEWKRARMVADAVDTQANRLQPVAPISGIIVTPQPSDLDGQYVAAGTPLLTIEDTRNLKARLYVPEFEVRDIHTSAPVSLHLYSFWSRLHGSVESIGSSPVPMVAGLRQQNRYKGLNPPSFYVVNVSIANDEGKLRTGMSGEAKIFVRRQSLAGMVGEEVRDFLARRIW
jgi:putative peptide zinc metalloprotease protein